MDWTPLLLLLPIPLSGIAYLVVWKWFPHIWKTLRFGHFQYHAFIVICLVVSPALYLSHEAFFIKAGINSSVVQELLFNLSLTLIGVLAFMASTFAVAITRVSTETPHRKIADYALDWKLMLNFGGVLLLSAIAFTASLFIGGSSIGVGISIAFFAIMSSLILIIVAYIRFSVVMSLTFDLSLVKRKIKNAISQERMIDLFASKPGRETLENHSKAYVESAVDELEELLLTAMVTSKEYYSTGATEIIEYYSENLMEIVRVSTENVRLPHADHVVSNETIPQHPDVFFTSNGLIDSLERLAVAESYVLKNLLETGGSKKFLTELLGIQFDVTSAFSHRGKNVLGSDIMRRKMLLVSSAAIRSNHYLLLTSPMSRVYDWHHFAEKIETKLIETVRCGQIEATELLSNCIGEVTSNIDSVPRVVLGRIGVIFATFHSEGEKIKQLLSVPPSPAVSNFADSVKQSILALGKFSPTYISSIASSDDRTKSTLLEYSPYWDNAFTYALRICFQAEILMLSRCKSLSIWDIVSLSTLANETRRTYESFWRMYRIDDGEWFYAGNIDLIRSELESALIELANYASDFPEYVMRRTDWISEEISGIDEFRS